MNNITTTRRATHQRPFRMGMTTEVPKVPFEPDLLDQAEVARRLNVSRTTVWRLIKRGDIRVVHIGSRALIPRTELHRLINEGSRGGNE